MEIDNVTKSQRAALTEFYKIKAKLQYLYGSEPTSVEAMVDRLIRERAAGFYGERISGTATRYDGDVFYVPPRNGQLFKPMVDEKEEHEDDCI